MGSVIILYKLRRLEIYSEINSLACKMQNIANEVQTDTANTKDKLGLTEFGTQTASTLTIHFL